MIKAINCTQPTKSNHKAVPFGAKFEYSQSVYKTLKETHDAIEKFSGKTGTNFDAEEFLLKLKNDFEKATENILGTVSISKDDYFEGINVSFRNAEGKKILSTLPTLKLFKKDSQNHEMIIQALKDKYDKLFESTMLPESNPFK